MFFWQNDTTSISLRLSKAWNKSLHGSVGRVRNNNAALCFHILFFCFFIVFHHKICAFIIFISLFDEVINFLNKILFKVETGIGGSKSLLELYVQYYWKIASHKLILERQVIQYLSLKEHSQVWDNFWQPNLATQFLLPFSFHNYLCFSCTDKLCSNLLAVSFPTNKKQETKNAWSNIFWYVKVCIFWKCIQNIEIKHKSWKNSLQTK